MASNVDGQIQAARLIHKTLECLRLKEVALARSTMAIRLARPNLHLGLNPRP